MHLKEILKREAVCTDLRAADKKGILSELAALAHHTYPNLAASLVLDVLLEREKLGSTGVGNGVAIPHGKIKGLETIVALFGRSKKGIDFQSHDHKPAELFFVLLAPENVVGYHLQALARLSRLLKDSLVRHRLMDAKDDVIYDVLINEDEKI